MRSSTAHARKPPNSSTSASMPFDEQVRERPGLGRRQHRVLHGGLDAAGQVRREQQRKHRQHQQRRHVAQPDRRRVEHLRVERAPRRNRARSARSRRARPASRATFHGAGAELRATMRVAPRRRHDGDRVHTEEQQQAGDQLESWSGLAVSAGCASLADRAPARVAAAAADPAPHGRRSSAQQVGGEVREHAHLGRLVTRPTGTPARSAGPAR